MANLTFRSILPTGQRLLGEGQGPDGGDRFDVFIDNIDLSQFEDEAALLVLAARAVDNGRNFITVNAPPEVSRQSEEDAQSETYYVGRVLENPSETWIPQVVRIAPGKLRASNNVLGIHTRNGDGVPAGNRDDFAVARIFLIYFGSQ